MNAHGCRIMGSTDGANTWSCRQHEPCHRPTDPGDPPAESL